MVANQRRLVGIFAVALCAVGLTACGSGGEGGADDGVKVTFVAYGGDGQKGQAEAWQEPYTQAHPEVTFVNTSPTDVAQVKAQVESDNVTWDVIATSPAAATQNCGTLFEPLTIDDINESELVDQTVGECYVGNFINATPFAYLTDAFPDPATAPKTIEDFFDVENFPGNRGMVTNLQNGILEYPLLADGVAADDLYPLDVDRSLAKLETIRDVTTFAPSVGALQQAVGAGQVDMFTLSDSRIKPLLEDGLDITVVWDQTVTSINAFAVPKGSENLAEVEKFLSWILTPEASANIAEIHGVAPVNSASEPDLSEEGKQVEVYGPLNTGETVLQDINWYADHWNEVSETLTRWLAG